MKKIFMLALVAVMGVALASCDNKDHPVRTSLDVDTSTLTLAVGESATRTATTKAQWDYQITYTSSNPAVATVDQTGKVTAKSEGEAVITVSMAETIKSWYAAKTLTYNVVVKKYVAVTGIAISGDAAINAGSSYTGQLTATVTPADATDPSVTWTSSHPGILALDANGNVSLVALPASTTNVTITATSNSNPAVSDSKVINVVGDPGIPLSLATSSHVGKVVASNGKIYDDATTAAGFGTVVGVMAKSTSTGHGYIISLRNVSSADWSTVQLYPGYVGSIANASGSKVVPSDKYGSLTGYTTLGSTTVSNWIVPNRLTYSLIWQAMGGVTYDASGYVYNETTNSYITAAGGDALSGGYYSLSSSGIYGYTFWNNGWLLKTSTENVRPVLAF